MTGSGRGDTGVSWLLGRLAFIGTAMISLSCAVPVEAGGPPLSVRGPDHTIDSPARTLPSPIVEFEPLVTAPPLPPLSMPAPTPTTQPTTTSQPVGPQLHVDVNGPADGDGSAERPFPTLEAGLRAVAPGETLIVHGGEYRERVKLNSELDIGRADAPIMVMAAPGENPVVRGVLHLRRLHHWTIDGIDVTWDEQRNSAEEHMVVLQNGSHWEYRNSEVWGARSYAGVLVSGDPVDWALRGLYIHDTHPTNDTNQDHLIYCNCGGGGGVIERNLLVGSENGRAIKVGTVSDRDSDISNVIIRYNTMVDNTGPANVQLSYRTSGIVIEHNLLVGVQQGRQNVTTYRLAGSGNIVRDNLGWGSSTVLAPDPGLIDGGGNVHLDPGLGADYRPSVAAATAYGHLAPG